MSDMNDTNVSATEAWQLCKAVDTSPFPGYPAGWEACPGWDNSNHAEGLFAVAARRCSDGTVAVAIQGTQNILDVIKDFNVDPETFDPIPGSRISKGSHNGLLELLAMKADDGTRLESFLRGLSGCELLITGHSLGGNLASVAAPWIASKIDTFKDWSSLRAITFAAPTAGDEVLKNTLDAQARYEAHFNLYDVVPHAWATDGILNLDKVKDFFPKAGPTPAPQEVQTIIDKKTAQIQAAGMAYQQTEGSLFEGEIQSGMSWMAQLAYQHNDAYDAQFPS